MNAKPRHSYLFSIPFLCVAIGKPERQVREASVAARTIEITCHDHCIIACSHHMYMGGILRAHLVRGESHMQRNANREVAIISLPFYSEPHRSHVLFVKAAPGTTCTSWSQHHFVAIGKPERQVRKASNCGGKQQYRSHAMITILLLVRAPYIWCYSSRTSRSWWIAHSTQRQPRGYNICPSGSVRGGSMGGLGRSPT